MALNVEHMDAINEQVKDMKSDEDVIKTHLNNIIHMKKLCDDVCAKFDRLKGQLSGLVRGSKQYEDKIKDFMRFRKKLITPIEKLLELDERGMRLTYRDLKLQRGIDPDKHIDRFLKEESTLSRMILRDERRIHNVLEHCKSFLSDEKNRERTIKDLGDNLKFVVHIFQYTSPLIAHAFNVLGRELRNIERQKTALERRRA